MVFFRNFVILGKQKKRYQIAAKIFVSKIYEGASQYSFFMYIFIIFYLGEFEQPIKVGVLS